MPLDLSRLRGNASRSQCIAHPREDGGCPRADAPEWLEAYRMVVAIRDHQIWRDDVVPPIDEWLRIEARRCAPLIERDRKAGLGLSVREHRERHPEAYAELDALVARIEARRAQTETPA